MIGMTFVQQTLQIFWQKTWEFFRILVGARDLRPLWNPPVSLNLVHVLVFFRNF
jgi:hypothetical protein